MKKLAVTSLLFITLFLTPADAYAQQYGQGTVLGESDEVKLEHKPVEAGLKENLTAVAGVLMFLAFALNYKAKVERQKAKFGIL